MNKEPKFTKRWFNANKIVVKFTPVLRRYGAKCQNPFESNNRKVWPGEEGFVVQETVHGNGWCETILVAKFTHGRSVHIARKLLTEDGELEWEFMLGFEPHEFKVVPKTVFMVQP